MQDLDTGLDSYLTDHHKELRQQVRCFAEAEVVPRIEKMEHSQQPDLELSQLIARQGWIGVTIGRGDGGMGMGHLAKTIIIEELSRVSAAMGAMVQASQLGVAKILHFGTQAQKDAWLPAVAIGRCLPTIAVTEPGSGSNVLDMAATAQRDGDDYVLRGHKVFVGNSHIADVHGVVVRTGPGSKGLSAFLVEADRPGVSLGDYPPTLGLHGFSFGDVFFDECRVPAANRIGLEGDGLAVAYSSSVLYGRPNLTAVALGVHRAIVEDTLEHVTQQQRRGAPLRDLPTIQQKLGHMRSQLMTSRLLAYHAAHELDHGRPCDADLINAKLVGVEALLDTERIAHDVQGAYGLRSSIGRYLRDAKHVLTPAGTPDVQRRRLAEMAFEDSTLRWWSTKLADQLRPDPDSSPTNVGRVDE